MSQVFSKLVVTRSSVSGSHILTNTEFQLDVHYDGSDIWFDKIWLYSEDGRMIQLHLGLVHRIQSDLRPYIYAHPIYQDILREYDPDDYDWHQQWKEDEAMGN